MLTICLHLSQITNPITLHGSSSAKTGLLVSTSTDPPDRGAEEWGKLTDTPIEPVHMSATYHIQPPEPFMFSCLEEWPKWARRFERFRSASGHTEKDKIVQVNMLLYSMGDEADDVLRSFKLSEADQKKTTFKFLEADQKKYEFYNAKFDQHFVKKCNAIFERAKFNMRKQEGESVDSFVTTLYALAEHCSCGGLYDKMIS